MRYVMGAVALAPFVLLLVAMATGRAHVQPCCPPAAPVQPDHRDPVESASDADPGA